MKSADIEMINPAAPDMPLDQWLTSAFARILEQSLLRDMHPPLLLAGVDSNGKFISYLAPKPCEPEVEARRFVKQLLKRKVSAVPITVIILDARGLSCRVLLDRADALMRPAGTVSH